MKQFKLSQAEYAALIKLQSYLRKLTYSDASITKALAKIYTMLANHAYQDMRS